MEGIIYFEINNWASGEYYPDDEPFTEWMQDNLKQYFQSKSFVKNNKLCVVFSIIDMSFNYCITCTKSWVEENCPKLLTEYKKFLRYPEDDADKVYGEFGNDFLPYTKENIGIHLQVENDDGDWQFDNDFDDWDD